MSAETIAPSRLHSTMYPRFYAVSRIPFAIRLDRLHEVLQAAMGWTNSHLYEICVGGVGCGKPI